MSSSPKEEEQVQLEEQPQNKQHGQNEGEDQVQDEEQPRDKKDGGKEEEVQLEEHARKKQDVDRKGKRKLEASSEDESFHPQKKGKEIELGGYVIKKYGNLSRHQYLDSLVHDADVQESFLLAILQYYYRHHRHPLHEDIELAIFMSNTLEVRCVDVKDLKKAIDMVWKDKKELEIREIEEKLKDKKHLKPKP